MRTCPGVDEVAAGIRADLEAGAKDRALRVLIQLNDDLVAGRIPDVSERPQLIGDPVWDASIAALVAWRSGELAPAWVNDPDRFLPELRMLELHPADPVPPADEVPAAFIERGVLVWADTFASV